MWTFYIGILLTIFSIGYFAIFPLLKRRPILLKKEGIITFIFSLFFMGFYFSNFISTVLLVVLIIIVLLTNAWFIFGITNEAVLAALDRASLVTKTTCKTTNKLSEIGDGMKVKMLSLMGKTHIITSKIKCDKSRMKITRVVFGKFIMNNFINN